MGHCHWGSELQWSYGTRRFKSRLPVVPALTLLSQLTLGRDPFDPFQFFSHQRLDLFFSRVISCLRTLGLWLRLKCFNVYKTRNERLFWGIDRRYMAALQLGFSIWNQWFWLRVSMTSSYQNGFIFENFPRGFGSFSIRFLCGLWRLIFGKST